MANSNVKFTQATILNAILAACEDGADFGAYGVPTAEVQAYCEKKITKLQNKVTKVNTAKAEARAELQTALKAILEKGAATASEVMKAYNTANNEEYSLPKITNALTAMVNNGEVTRSVVKKVAYFSLA
jgi:hypothetical protein